MLPIKSLRSCTCWHSLFLLFLHLRPVLCPQGGIVAKEGDDANLTLVDPQDSEHTLGSNTFRIREVCWATCKLKAFHLVPNQMLGPNCHRLQWGLTLDDLQDAEHTLGSNTFRIREVCEAMCMAIIEVLEGWFRPCRLLNS